jgi:putative nucleotidyltransferase with HDIG domain
VDLDYIHDRLGKVETLPTFPGIVAEVIQIMGNPMSSASDLARTMDPSMVGEVLRIANSAYYGARNFRNISNVEHAIAVLGFEQVSQIVLQMPFLSMLKGAEGGFDREMFLRHSILTGLVARAISISACVGHAEEVYVSGTLHDIGKVVLYQFFKEERRAVKSLMEEGLAAWEAEREVLSVDHGVLGARVLERWNLPGTVTEAVLLHHDRDCAPEEKGNVVVTRLANDFSKDLYGIPRCEDFSQFTAESRHLTERLKPLGIQFKPSEEVEFLERLQTAVARTDDYIQGISGRNND